MVPGSRGCRGTDRTAPRTRGDGPAERCQDLGLGGCSPHPRGWSPRRHRCERQRLLLPAPAGMVPAGPDTATSSLPAPRTRGDGPTSPTGPGRCCCCSPHPRGWSLHQARQLQREGLLPAPAGMVPSTVTAANVLDPAPRTRGDGPKQVRDWDNARPCSPHPRGWSLLRLGKQSGIYLLPAPAGMVPAPSKSPPTSTTAPRTRGDGPRPITVSVSGPVCSPHPRGWSHPTGDAQEPGRLLPAPAGMVPSATRGGSGGLAAPRTRGDGPGTEASASCRSACSPHPRGWSHRHGLGREDRDLLPAPAGMVPRTKRGISVCFTAPRTRGDGPRIIGTSARPSACSPHPRGWSLQGGSDRGPRALLPAPAGMVPRP